MRGGPWVPVRIFVEREVDIETGELTSPEVFVMEVAGKRASNPARAFHYLTPIPRAEYERLMEAHRTNPVMQATHARVDFTASPVRP